MGLKRKYKGIYYTEIYEHQKVVFSRSTKKTDKKEAEKVNQQHLKEYEALRVDGRIKPSTLVLYRESMKHFTFNNIIRAGCQVLINEHAERCKLDNL